jgi:hypothetical protein
VTSRLVALAAFAIALSAQATPKLQSLFDPEATGVGIRISKGARLNPQFKDAVVLNGGGPVVEARISLARRWSFSIGAELGLYDLHWLRPDGSELSHVRSVLAGPTATPLTWRFGRSFEHALSLRAALLVPLTVLEGQTSAQWLCQLGLSLHL